MYGLTAACCTGVLQLTQTSEAYWRVMSVLFMYLYLCICCIGVLQLTQTNEADWHVMSAVKLTDHL